MLTYRFDPEIVHIQEAGNGDDVEFLIRVLKEQTLVVDGLKQVREWFESNGVHTDVLFYAYPDQTYKVIVRRDYYVEFVLELMKRKLLQSVAWKA
jgi:hypothetical protein